MNRLYEKTKIDSEFFAAATAASAFTGWYDMSGFQHCDVICDIFNVASSKMAAPPVIRVLQSTDKDTYPTSAADYLANSSRAGSVFISSVATVCGPAESITLTIASAAAAGTTHGDYLVINGLTFTYSTAESTAAASSNRAFHSTLASSAAGGPELIAKHLATMINNATFGVPGVYATTRTTAALDLRLTGEVATCKDITVYSTDLADWGAVAKVSRAVLSFDADQLTADHRYVALEISSMSTTYPFCVKMIRYGERMPIINSTRYHKVITT